MAEPIRILHLSDIHFREESKEDFSAVLYALNDTVAKIVQDGKRPDFVVITGDLVWSGKESDYRLARTWIDTHLLKPIKGFRKSNLLIVPGNHDVNLKSSDSAVEGIENVIREGDQRKITDILKREERRNIVLERQKEYMKFFNGYRPRKKVLTVPWWSKTCRFNNGISIGFAGLATSLIAHGNDVIDYGKLVLGDYQVDNVLRNLRKVNVRIALIHHPVSYLIGEERRWVFNRLLKDFSIVLRGHLHEQESIMYMTKKDPLVELATGSAYHDRRYDNTFQVIEIDTEEKIVIVQYWLWKDNDWIIDRNVYQTDDGYSRFPLRIFNESNIKPASSKQIIKRVDAREGYSREFVKLPLSWKAKEMLNKSLVAIQKKAFRELKKRYKKLMVEHIRANVFLPDYRNAKKFEDILLYIPDCLRVNMNFQPELDIKFPPKKGATGVSFDDGKPRFTKRISKRAGEWESTLKMTRELRKKVHKDLKWILSIPLKDPSEKNVILGVMNIDGLNCVISEGIVKKLLAKLFTDLLIFMIYLSERQRETVKFYLE